MTALGVTDGKVSTVWVTDKTIAAKETMPAFAIKTNVMEDLPAGYTAIPSEVQKRLVPVKTTLTWQEPGGVGDRTLEIISYYYLK